MDGLLKVGGGGGAAKALGLDLSPADMKQADQFLKMLDEMAENDPAAYSQFLKQQMAAAREEVERTADPSVDGLEPLLVLEAAALPAGAAIPGKTTALVHIWAAKDGAGIQTATCSSSTGSPTPPGGAARIPVSESTTSWEGLSIPVAEYKAPTTSNPQPQANGAVTHRLHVLLHHRTARLVALGTPPAFRGLVAEAVCQFVEHKYRLLLSRTQRAFQVARHALTAKELQELAAAQQEQALQAASSSGGSSPLPQALMNDLRGLAVGPSSGGELASGGGGGGGGRGAAAPKRPLIVDLSQQQGAPAGGQGQASSAPPVPAAGSVPASAPTGAAVAPAGVPPTGPGRGATAASASTHVAVEEDAAGQRWVRVQVSGMPGVQRARDVDLEVVGGREVVVTPLSAQADAATAAGAVQPAAVRIALPVPVDGQRVQAKFDPKAKVLTLSLAVAE